MTENMEFATFIAAVHEQSSKLIEIIEINLSIYPDLPESVRDALVASRSHIKLTTLVLQRTGEQNMETFDQLNALMTKLNEAE